MSPQKIYLVRHSERIDQVLGNDWVSKNFTGDGEYRRTNANLPAKLGPHPGDYHEDSPITNYGKFVARSVGESMRDFGVKIDVVVSSPALRCIETCANLLEGLNCDIPIKLEPGLYEWCGLFNCGVPAWFSEEILIEKGVNIDVNYRPVLSRQYFEKNEEDLPALYRRCKEVVNELLNKFEGQNIMLVVHTITLDACTRPLLNLSVPNTEELNVLVPQVPYCALLEFQNTNGGWKLNKPPVHPMTHSDIKKFDWTLFSK